MSSSMWTDPDSGYLAQYKKQQQHNFIFQKQ